MQLLAEVAQERARRGAAVTPMEATVLDPALTADGFVRVEVDRQPGRVRECPWTLPAGGRPLPGDAALVTESDAGNLWAHVWPSAGPRWRPAWTAPGYAPGWADYAGANGPWGPAAYVRDPLGTVRLRGLVSKASAWSPGETIFTLPPGFRPANHLVVPALADQRLDRITVYRSGAVALAGFVAWASGLSWLSLHGVEFIAEG